MMARGGLASGGAASSDGRRKTGKAAQSAPARDADCAAGGTGLTGSTVIRMAEARLPTRDGDFRMILYGARGDAEHIALIRGSIDENEPALVRLHSECLTGDVLGSRRCDCGEQLEHSLSLLATTAGGVLLYLRQEGRGIGLGNKIRAYALQDRGYDTVEANLALGLPADRRDYGDAAAILHDLGVRRVRLLTNNPAKIAGLERHGITVVERLPLYVTPNAANLSYLRVKLEKLGHLPPPGQGLQQAGD